MSATRDVEGRTGRVDLARWLAGHTLYGVPMAAAPIAFGLLGLEVTCSAAAGAAMVFAMTAASVLGAVPVSRLGRRATYYSLVLDELAPAGRRAEAFALLRTASAVGVIAVSGTLALLGLRAVVLGSFAALLVAVALVTLRAARATRATRATRAA